MEQIEELYQKLKEAYSHNNLNRITRKLIELYKAKDFGKIRGLANKVSRYVPINEEQDARCFSKLAVLYHPDKGQMINAQLLQHYNENDLKSLENYAHVLLLDTIDEIVVTPRDESIDYSPEYEWDYQEKEGFSVFGENDNDNEKDNQFVEYERSFYNEVKYRQYGDLAIEFPPHYLEDFEDFEMAECGMETLDGIEYCIHAKIVDLSGNKLTDITELGALINLEELYLANNEIGYIDILSNLPKLKVLDISGNQVDDLSPLLDLDELEYVNLIDNPVSEDQVEELQQKGVVVMFQIT